MTVLQDFALIEQAIAANHRVFFRIEARGDERQTGPVIWTRTREKHSQILFPRLSGPETGLCLDRLMDTFREAPPLQAGCWSLDPPEPGDLGLHLLARGFQPGWRPYWMYLDLENDLQGPSHPGLEIVADKVTDLRFLTDLPFAASEVMIQTGEYLTQRFIARLDGQIVGQSGVLCTEGPLGVAGLYNVSVRPAYRSKGIGKALTVATCRFARDRGWRFATLNASGDGRRIYSQLGFRSLSEGWTWWLMNDRWINVSPAEVALAEAVGSGRFNGLAPSSEDLRRPLSNGMTLMELAIHCHQPDAAAWLMKKGISLRPLEAWDLGWKDHFAELLSTRPDLVNERYGEGALTILHTAIVRNDIDLLRQALTADPDLGITDKTHGGTALGWAYHFGRQEMIALLEVS